MLLCCFREAKTKDDEGDDENAPKSSSKKRQKAAAKSAKDAAPLSREQKRLIKQRSRESLRRLSSDNPGSRPVSEVHPIPSQPPQPAFETSCLVNTNVISSDAAEIYYSSTSSSCYSPPPRLAQVQQQQQNSAAVRSTPNLKQDQPQQQTPVNKSSLPQSASLQQVPLGSPDRASTGVNYRRRSSGSSSCLSNEPVLTGAATVASPVNNGRGIVRSSASYGIQQMLQEQIILEEKAKEQESARAALEKELKSKHEEQLAQIRREHNQRISEMNEAHKTALNNLRNSHRTEVEQCEQRWRSKLKRETESLSAKVESAEADKARIAKECQQRDQDWQREKQDVLKEIQRLKDEANRFIAILAAEDEEEEEMSPAKRQNLTREVESLQLVLEMRTQELKRLREERSQHLEQLEELEATRGALAKARAKVEDLQAVLERKNESERLLSLEKSNLETSFEEEAKKKERASMKVEELQWRIKHKMELPPTQVFEKQQHQQRSSGPNSIITNNANTATFSSITNTTTTSSRERPDSLLGNKNLLWSTNSGNNQDVIFRKTSLPAQSFVQQFRQQQQQLQQQQQQQQQPEQQTPNNNTGNEFPRPDATAAAPEKSESNPDSLEYCDGVVDKEEDVENKNLVTEQGPTASDITAEEGAPNKATNEKEEENAIKDCGDDSDDAVDNNNAKEDVDEGLGDIGSEASASPQPLEDKDSKIVGKEVEDDLEKGDAMKEVEEMQFTPPKPKSLIDSLASSPLSPTGGIPSIPSSPADERMPSRIALSIETKL